MLFFFNKNNKDKIKLYTNRVIKLNVPWYKNPTIMIASVVIIVSMCSSYLYLNYSLQNTLKQLSKVSRKYNSLSDKYDDLKVSKVKLQRELEIVQQSQVKIKDNLLSMHQQSQDLTEQVDLYKRIMAPDGIDANISIENVHLRRINETNDYYLSFVLLQLSKKKTRVEGLVDFNLNGQIDQKPKTIAYSKIAVDKKFPMRYRFSDFQQINEKITLPQDFQVKNLIITVTDNKLKQTKKTNFDWSSVGGQEIHVAKN